MLTPPVVVPQTCEPVAIFGNFEAFAVKLATQKVGCVQDARARVVKLEIFAVLEVMFPAASCQAI